MKQDKITTALLIILLFLLLFGCKKSTVTEPQNERVYTVKVLNKFTSSPVRQATFIIPTEDWWVITSTDEKGIAVIEIPNDTKLPQKTVGLVYESSVIMPEGINFSGAESVVETQTIKCEPIPSTVIIYEPHLRHIGNDYYTTEPNSQLQIPTEGLKISYSFNLSNIPNIMPYIRFCARGIEGKTKIKINNITVDQLGNSSPDGSLSKYNFQLTADPHTVLKTGTNILTFETAYITELEDWDDIEYCALLLYYP